MDDLERQAAQALAGIEQAETLDTLESLRVGLLGKSGIVTAALKTLGTLAPEQRKALRDQWHGMTQAQRNAWVEANSPKDADPR